jgi:ribosomal protein S18 acetylase RimI-like enzyme
MTAHDSTSYLIRRVTPGEWRSLRALRLEALKDSPQAFSTTYAASDALPDEAWQAQATRVATDPSAALYVAVDAADPTGPWLGMAGAEPLRDVPATAHVHSVYVTPPHRGRTGPATALVTAAVAFAEAHLDVDHLSLGVHETNLHAQAFYARLGFEPTGLRVPYALNADERLVIMGYPAFRHGGL